MSIKAEMEQKYDCLFESIQRMQIKVDGSQINELPPLSHSPKFPLILPTTKHPRLTSPEFPLIPPAIETLRLIKNSIDSQTFSLESSHYDGAQTSGMLYSKLSNSNSSSTLKCHHTNKLFSLLPNDTS
jgi:hypothetical protein